MRCHAAIPQPKTGINPTPSPLGARSWRAGGIAVGLLVLLVLASTGKMRSDHHPVACPLVGQRRDDAISAAARSTVVPIAKNLAAVKMFNNSGQYSICPTRRIGSFDPRLSR